MPDPPDDLRASLDAQIGLQEPQPGPEGYHADFSRPFGLPEDAHQGLWVARVYVGAGRDLLFGPWNTRDEVVAWVLSLDLGDLWMVEPVRKPEDWLGAPLQAPEEPETPLFPGLKEAPDA